MQFQTGTPCGIGTNNDFAGVGKFGGFGVSNCPEGQFWVLNGPVTINKAAFAGLVTTSTLARYFTVTVSPPPAGGFNLQHGVRDSIYAPGLQDWNIGLLKNFPVTEKTFFEFRAEAYNFINHPNLPANWVATSGQFGMITGKTSLARKLQLSLRFQF
jgi:hypothetical protein